MKINDVLQYLEKRFPYELASDFDKGKIGLVIGERNIELKGILCALDLNNEVIEEAIQNDVNLIITHHPLLFNGITKILFDEEKGFLIKKMIKNDIALISMHTNMDLGIDGVADSLALKLGMTNSNYGSNLKDDYSRIGYIEEITLDELINKIKQIFGLNGVKVVEGNNSKINKIAILGGSGGQEFEISHAIKEGCQVYITGEIKHHVALYAKFYGITLIEVNHGIEQVVFDKLVLDLQEEFNINVKKSQYDFNLFVYK